MARIANNIAALNSWRQLTKNETMFSSSLEKLSSGYPVSYTHLDVYKRQP